MDDWDENRYKENEHSGCSSFITVFIEHMCAVGNCKDEKKSMPSTKLDKVFVDYITIDLPYFSLFPQYSK